MSNRFVRSSKFRHVFGTPYKKENCYDSIKITKSPHESSMCSVNKKFIAVVLEGSGGGSFMVAPLSKVGRFDIDYPKVAGHKGLVLDIQWNPFNDNEIASCSEDCTIKLWTIPDGGFSTNMTDAKKELQKHQKKVSFLAWHPSAANVLLSVGFDQLLVIWNTETGSIIAQNKTIHTEQIYSVSWSYNGSHIATTCKDKKIRVIEARTMEVKTEGKGHEGTKPSKVTFCGRMNKLFSTGFTRSSDRQYALWDAGDLSKPLTMEKIDSSSGVLFPFWDEGTGMVYALGKGDSQFRYFEVTDATPYVFFLSMYQGKDPVRGAACMPKKDLDYMKCEVMRFYRLLTKNCVEPLSMTVPRKSDMFQDDIYPPCPSGVPALTAEEWVGGTNKDPILVSFSDSGLTELSAAESQVSKEIRFKSDDPAPKKEPSVLKRLNSPQPDDARAMPVTHEEYKKAYKELLEENEKLRKKIAQLEGN